MKPSLYCIFFPITILPISTFFKITTALMCRHKIKPGRVIDVFLPLKTDIVPDPPDGPPVIEAITGKTITLSWKKPKRLDPSFGGFTNLLWECN